MANEVSEHVILAALEKVVEAAKELGISEYTDNGSPLTAGMTDIANIDLMEAKAELLGLFGL